ncbi:MAG TPA: DUF4192 domain-containing protein [Actinophytocola sp.]|jgi:hypothetical protein|uniref:DUF4192 domain-containing protein n=1 Tax=Actinophytocola sp. TaxID=1872138 RepID=UPI002E0714A2|nr:DUF4192 domain-containing protein [Actinophytocola sp.]
MTTPLRTSLLCDDPGELIAAIPGLLRFVPTDSLVLVTYSGQRELHLECVLRLDIPEPEDAPVVAAHLRLVALNHAASVIELVVLCGAAADPPEPIALPARALVEVLANAFEGAGIVVSHAIWAPGIAPDQIWRCYEDPDCAGRVRDPVTCPVTTAVTVAGQVTFATRAELAGQLTPDPPGDLARRAELIAALPPAVPEQEYPYVRDTLDQLDPAAPVSDVVTLDDATVARLAHALSNPDIREACLAFALTVRATAAERVWTALTRATPAPALAGPATLLAACAYLRGDGALAAVALETARSADPGHRLANIVRRIITFGVTPAGFRTMLGQCFAAAFTER